VSTYHLQKASPSEDAVTGLLVDLLRAWPDRETLLALLGRPDASSRDVTCPIPDFDEVTIEAWPRWRSSEPDILLGFRRAGADLARLIIEIKIGADKSSEDSPEGPLEQPETTNDQLAKYQHLALERWPGTPVTVVYLTHHGHRPEKDLETSLARMKMPSCQGSTPLLVWRSWRDVECDLGALADRRDDRSFNVYARGLADVLRSLSLFRFRGVWQRSTGAPGSETPPSPLWWKPGPSTRHARRTREGYRWQPADMPTLPPCPTHLIQPWQYRWRLPGSIAPGHVASFYRRSS
jgi:hypothetical protein